MTAPLPPSQSDLIAIEQATEGTNRSLVFHRGIDTYEQNTWSFDGERKREFFARFISRYSQGKADYSSLLRRRHSALRTAGCTGIPARAVTPVVLGLGISHPTENGLLLDRTTGCPYLPGSSVKGTLRAAAKLVAREELDGNATFWAQYRDRVFGPAIDRTVVPARGACIFYDVFPTQWPALSLEVMTPHYLPYYAADSGSEVPADWHDPKPIVFLAIQPGTEFLFFVRTLPLPNDLDAEETLAQVIALLRTALDWLGVGGKTSAGHGVFDSDSGEARIDDRAGEPEIVVWDNANVVYAPQTGLITARHGHTTASVKRDDLLEGAPEWIRTLLSRKKREWTLSVEVRLAERGGWEIVRLIRPQ